MHRGRTCVGLTKCSTGKMAAESQLCFVAEIPETTFVVKRNGSIYLIEAQHQFASSNRLRNLRLRTWWSLRGRWSFNYGALPNYLGDSQLTECSLLMTSVVHGISTLVAKYFSAQSFCLFSSIGNLRGNAGCNWYPKWSIGRSRFIVNRKLDHMFLLEIMERD